jgi:hypothetical protein
MTVRPPYILFVLAVFYFPYFEVNRVPCKNGTENGEPQILNKGDSGINYFD